MVNVSEGMTLTIQSIMTTHNAAIPGRKSKAAAYGLWCLCFVGICGAQRLYSNKIGSGILYLITLGVFGFGQFIDLFLTAEMVDSYNRGHGYNLPGAYSNPLAQQQVVVNVGESIHSAIAEIKSKEETTTESQNDEQKILKECVNQPISIAMLAVKTGIEPKRVKMLTEKLEAEGMLTADITDSGKIKYAIN